MKHVHARMQTPYKKGTNCTSCNNYSSSLESLGLSALIDFSCADAPCRRQHTAPARRASAALLYPSAWSHGAREPMLRLLQTLMTRAF
jgi:hypothetical protein